MNILLFSSILNGSIQDILKGSAFNHIASQSPLKGNNNVESLEYIKFPADTSSKKLLFSQCEGVNSANLLAYKNESSGCSELKRCFDKLPPCLDTSLVDRISPLLIFETDLLNNVLQVTKAASHFPMDMILGYCSSKRAFFLGFSDKWNSFHSPGPACQIGMVKLPTNQFRLRFDINMFRSQQYLEKPPCTSVNSGYFENAFSVVSDSPNKFSSDSLLSWLDYCHQKIVSIVNIQFIPNDEKSITKILQDSASYCTVKSVSSTMYHKAQETTSINCIEDFLYRHFLNTSRLKYIFKFQHRLSDNLYDYFQLLFTLRAYANIAMMDLLDSNPQFELEVAMLAESTTSFPETCKGCTDTLNVEGRTGSNMKSKLGEAIAKYEHMPVSVTGDGQMVVLIFVKRSDVFLAQAAVNYWRTSCFKRYKKDELCFSVTQYIINPLDDEVLHLRTILLETDTYITEVTTTFDMIHVLVGLEGVFSFFTPSIVYKSQLPTCAILTKSGFNFDDSVHAGVGGIIAVMPYGQQSVYCSLAGVMIASAASNQHSTSCCNFNAFVGTSEAIRKLIRFIQFSSEDGLNDTEYRQFVQKTVETLEALNPRFVMIDSDELIFQSSKARKFVELVSASNMTQGRCNVLIQALMPDVDGNLCYWILKRSKNVSIENKGEQESAITGLVEVPVHVIHWDNDKEITQIRSALNDILSYLVTSQSDVDISRDVSAILLKYDLSIRNLLERFVKPVVFTHGDLHYVAYNSGMSSEAMAKSCLMLNESLTFVSLRQVQLSLIIDGYWASATMLMIRIIYRAIAHDSACEMHIASLLPSFANLFHAMTGNTAKVGSKIDIDEFRLIDVLLESLATQSQSSLWMEKTPLKQGIQLYRNAIAMQFQDIWSQKRLFYESILDPPATALASLVVAAPYKTETETETDTDTDTETGTETTGERAGTTSEGVYSPTLTYEAMNSMRKDWLDFQSNTLRPVIESRSEKIHILTYATNASDPGLANLLLTSTIAGVPIEVLGLETASFESYRDKLVGYYSRLFFSASSASSSYIQDDDVVLIIDAYDVLLFPRVRRVGEVLLVSQTPVIACAEAGVYPEQLGAYFYPSRPLRDMHRDAAESEAEAGMAEAETLASAVNSVKYLNSGCLLGTGKYMRMLFSAISSQFDYIRDDQQLFVRALLQMPHLLSVDTHSLFSHCLYQQSRFFTLQDFYLNQAMEFKLPRTITMSSASPPIMLLHANNMKANYLYELLSNNLISEFYRVFLSGTSAGSDGPHLLRVLWAIADGDFEDAKKRLAHPTIQRNATVNRLASDLEVYLSHVTV